MYFRTELISVMFEGNNHFVLLMLQRSDVEKEFEEKTNGIFFAHLLLSLFRDVDDDDDDEQL